jgi:hypothetical protein
MYECAQGSHAASDIIAKPFGTSIERQSGQFPARSTSTSPLSEVYSYQLINIVAVEVYIVDDKMVYVLKVPLTSHSVYDVYRILPFPIKKQVYIYPAREGNYFNG